MANYKFPKSERLTNKKKFDHLFESGKTIKAYPFRLIYLTEVAEDDIEKMQFAFTVPKRSFKKAVERNYLKRRMKEAFRLHKNDLYESIDLNKDCLYAILIYTSREKLDYHQIEKGWLKLMKKLVAELTP